MRRPWLWLGVACVLTASPAAAQQFPLEHFQCYAIRKADPAVQVPLELLDQFDRPEVVDHLRARRFCNPVGKWHRGVFNPVEDIRQHLTFYATFPQDGPIRIVQLSNQFDRPGVPPPVWRLREPVALAVPTVKPPHDKPEGLDHYRCYAAAGNPVFEGVGLVDQFVAFGARFVLDPVMFCNPVQKLRLDTGEVTPVRNPEQHLACYSITRVPFAAERDVDNQFGRQLLVLGPPDTLCVPTRKISWTEIPDGPIGAGMLEEQKR